MPNEPIARTPDTPYYAVIFTSQRSPGDDSAYGAMADRMLALAAEQDGYLGVESVRDSDGVGITVSYWRDHDSIRRWRAVAEHREAQRLGKEKWYAQFQLRVSLVERQFHFDSSSQRENEND